MNSSALTANEGTMNARLAADSSARLRLNQIRGTKGEEGMKSASKAFAGMFLGQMMKMMRSTIQKAELGHGGPGEEIFQEMMDQEMADEIAWGDSYGLSELIYESMSRKASMRMAPMAVDAPVTTTPAEGAGQSQGGVA